MAIMKRSDFGASFSHAEFDALPNSVQRKCFSSLERLRLADQAAESLEDKQSHIRSGQSVQSFPYASSRRSSSIAVRSSVRRALSRRRVRKAESVQLQLEQEAQFFALLPPKLRKQHFSPQEQADLIGRCDPSFLPEPVAERAQQRFDDFQFGFFDDPPATPSPERGRPRRRSRSLSPTRIPIDDDEALETDDEDEGSLLHADTMSPPLSYRMPGQSPPFRRTLSLTSIPVRRSTSSTPYIAEAALVPFGPPLRHTRAVSLSFSNRRSSHTHTPTPPIIDPSATHYQDPEARKKLRMIASAQKFDEAVEFGFPSLPSDHHAPSTTTTTSHYHLPPITTDARNFSRDMQTFLRDDTFSFLDDLDNDDLPDTDTDSLPDLDSPATPSSAAGLSFRCHTRHASPSNFSSAGSHILATGPLPSAPRLNREMTLRMTLTRPDLRADEEQLYGWQNQGVKSKEKERERERDDPFALEALKLSDDMTGSKGPFYVKPRNGGLVARLFKRGSRRGR
ncbi:hypothetical protein M011DRAFT_464507 [Sporormia fimetaria CBS 119925]|uniref:Uncharacterized protein n=1 Tax=Sporormia fimetaria CBS 119925 TaxID=1340428 RepID=A0A6A6VN97_9PLEO|nr:hypothetical protein M011DRAFT_464507 [Sporormia fimetaria CBS 119925]